VIRHLKGPAQSAAPTAATGAVGGADDHVANVVTEIIDAVAERGDEAVRHYSRTLDNWQPEHFRLSDDAIAAVIAQVPAQTRSDIAYAQARVRAFAEAQLASMSEIEVTALPGVILGHRHLPVATVGAYVPGGRYPLLASAHMTILTAKVAGVPRVIACTPPDQGRLPAATIAAMLAMAAIGAASLWAAPPGTRLAVLLGGSWSSCPWIVLALSLPALAATLHAMRGLAPTRPRAAGAAAGLLAGSIGAIGYALHCPEAALAFVATWYTAGIALAGALGAALGPRVLRW